MPRALGVLVAGGRGARLGLGVPKALVEVGGVTLLERALATLRAVCDEVVVVAPWDLELPIAEGSRVNDALDGAGPLAGLVAGLEARRGARALVLGVDFPRMRSAALAALLERLEEGVPAVVPAPDGIPQPLASAYAPASASRLRASLEAGERSLTRAVLALGPTLLDPAGLSRLPGGLDNFFNLNTPSDLERARQLFAAPPLPRGLGSPA